MRGRERERERVRERWTERNKERERLLEREKVRRMAEVPRGKFLSHQVNISLERGAPTDNLTEH